MSAPWGRKRNNGKALFTPVFPEMHKNIVLFEGFYVSPTFSSVTCGANIIQSMLCTHFYYDFTFESYKEFIFHRPRYKVQFVLYLARNTGCCRQQDRWVYVVQESNNCLVSVTRNTCINFLDKTDSLYC